MIRIGYRLAWSLARPVSRLLPPNGKVARSLRGRFAAAATLASWAADHRTTAPLVWFHAASVGEGKQAEAALLRLREAHPTWQIAYTYSSASAERFAAVLPVDVAAYLPADVPEEVGRVLDAVRPSVIVFAATDLWPVFVTAAAARGVPVALISGTLAPTSSRRGVISRSLLGPAYRSLRAVGAISAADADRLLALGAPPSCVQVTGDTRHDSAARRAAAVELAAPHLAALGAPGAPLLVAGSTWLADVRVLLPAWGALAERPRLVIAPHEPTPAALELIRRVLALAAPGAVVRTLSELERLHPPPAPWDVCLVDRVGVLADLYAMAWVAFVGGGFHRHGLHSVIEPAALGVPVTFGPRWHGSRDARLLLGAGGARTAATRDELAGILADWRDPHAHDAAGAAALGVVRAGLGAADRSARLIEGLVGEEGEEGEKGEEGE